MPGVEPPGLLKAAGALSILSVVGVLLYAVAQSVTGTGGLETRGIAAAYLAVLHFVLPFVVFYTITANSPLSRLAIAAYVLILSTATMAGKGLLGELQFDPVHKAFAAVAVSVVVFYWLFGSARMRFYYAAISNKPMSPDLASRAEELHGGNWLSPKARESLAWFLDHMETIVLVGFIVAAIYAFVSTTNLSPD
jgi:hypothetical protein